ncbi:PH domain-containing protein [Streptomyces sp. NPDC001536]|uniref:PH domain-containing protein n=1 Tax=Streptomyces sp. NPDC001536 TaxID=3364583 RepID=UPI0036882FAC
MDGLEVEREYRKRRKIPGRFIVIVGCLLLNPLVRVAETSNSLPLWVRVGFLLAAVLAAGWMVLRLRRSCTLVTTDGITVRGAFAERHRAWHDIYDLRVEPLPRGANYTGQNFVTYLYLKDGRRHGLPHVDDRQLADPWSEVAGLLGAAGRHRGAPFEPRPAVEALIRKRAARARAWVRAFYGAFIVFMCDFLLWGVLMATTNGEPSLILYILYAPLAAFVLLAVLQLWSARRHP